MSFKKIKKDETAPLLSYAAIPPGSSLSSSSIAPPPQNYNNNNDNNDNKNNNDYNQPAVQEEDKGGSILVVVLTVFLQSIGFTVTLNSMYFYITKLNIPPNELSAFYGAIVAIYSAGQFLGSPIFGFWSNHAPARLVIVVSLFISAIGNVLYGFVGNLPAPGWMMLLSRFLVGLGAGNVAVCRAYASEASTLANRAGTMAKMSMAQGMGFVVGPILGYLLHFCNFHMGSIPISQYTAPGFVSAVFGIGNTIFAAICFKELNSRLKKNTGESKPVDIEKPTKSELISIFIAIFLFFVVIAVFSIFETMITVVTNHDFGWSATDNGILLVAVGALSVVVFIIISTPYMKRKDDRKMMFFGTCLQIVGLAVATTWKWPFKIQNHLTYGQLYTAAILIGIGYPIASAYMFAIYSKVLNPSFQGTKMGWLTAGGSLARMLGPIWATHAFKIGGGELLFLGTDALVVISLIVLIIFYSRLAPHPAYFANSNPALLSVNAADEKNVTK